jgi:hypothetical protein
MSVSLSTLKRSNVILAPLQPRKFRKLSVDCDDVDLISIVPGLEDDDDEDEGNPRTERRFVEQWSL